MTARPLFSRPALRPATATRLVAIAAPIYFAWELLQMPGYVASDAWLTRLGGCAVATLGDVAIVFGLWWSATLVSRDSRWFAPPRMSRYAFVIIAALVVNIAVEWVVVDRLGVWSYSPRQPTIPWVGTGLFAVLQALVLPPVTFYALARWDRRRSPHDPGHDRR